MKKFLMCIALVLILSACSNDHVMRFNLSPYQNVKTAPTYEGRSHFLFWGMLQKTDYNMLNLCPMRGIKAIETHWTFYDSLMGALTMGLYAPESFSVYCN